MGLGIVGARRLMDRFHVDTAPAGHGGLAPEALARRGHRSAVTPAALDRLSRRARRASGPTIPLEELQRAEPGAARARSTSSARRQDELVRLNRELEDTNRGVVALYAELDEKADHLRRADEMKSRFLSNMSHEFRTPLNSILALTPAPARRRRRRRSPPSRRSRSRFIRKAAEDLSELVNDLLDLAKVEAGKIVVRPATFEVAGPVRRAARHAAARCS